MSVARKRSSGSGSEDERSSATGERASKKAKISTVTNQKAKTVPSDSELISSDFRALAAHKNQTDDEGNPYWSLNGSGSRRIGISTFKGMVMVGLREYYEKDGSWLPGKKGISLPMEQFAAFLAVLPQIERSLAELGTSVPRPVYGEVIERSEVTAAKEPNEVEETSKKQNHEATSDEDER